MNALVPRSLAGRLMLVLALALFFAQLTNFALILNEREKLSLVQNTGPAVTRFASAAADISDAAPEFRTALLSDLSHRGARYRLTGVGQIADSQRSAETEARLLDALQTAGVQARAVRASESTSIAPGRGTDRANRPRRTLTLEAQLPAGAWLSGDIPVPSRDPWLSVRLGAATIALYLIVLGASFLVIRQVARPLQALTSAARRFRGKAEPEPVEPAGPDDVREAIDAFNEMNARLLKLLDDKDRVLGAIGHDLRTPLASLRIRLETMEPETERIAAVRKVDEMTGTLEDILMLAQTGRSHGQMRRADVTSIVDAVIEEFRDLGASVEFGSDQPFILDVHPNLLRRAVSNLVDNALKYGGHAAVWVSRHEDMLHIAVADTGPGIDPAILSKVHEPFFRAEGSRNRSTGGTGLGLAIAKSIADLHQGELVLRNGPTGGLIAEFRLAMRTAEE